jgi:hypothetical protein
MLDNLTYYVSQLARMSADIETYRASLQLSVPVSTTCMSSIFSHYYSLHWSKTRENPGWDCVHYDRLNFRANSIVGKAAAAPLYYKTRRRRTRRTRRHLSCREYFKIFICSCPAKPLGLQPTSLSKTSWLRC